MAHHHFCLEPLPAQQHLRLGLTVSLRLVELASLSETPPPLLQLPSLVPPHSLWPLSLPQLLLSLLVACQQTLRTLFRVLLRLLPLEGLILGRHSQQHRLEPLHLPLKRQGFLLEPTTPITSLLLEHQLLLLARRLQEYRCHLAALEPQDLEQWAPHRLVLHQPPSLSEQAPNPLGLVGYKHADHTRGRSNMADASPVPFIVVVWTLQLLFWLSHLPQKLLLVQTQQGSQSDLISTILQTVRAGQACRIKAHGVLNLEYRAAPSLRLVAPTETHHNLANGVSKCLMRTAGKDGEQERILLERKRDFQIWTHM